MTISMHSASAPVFDKMLGNLLKWLDAAKAHAEVKTFDTSVYLSMRLAPDMLPFTRQIQIASDAVKGCMARLSGQAAPSWEDSEATLDELIARVQKTKDYVATFSAVDIDGSEDRIVEIPRRTGDPLKMRGEVYLRHYALANFHFHLMTTYSLLRHAGVSLGKMDYLGLTARETGL